jgi:hypothetical protein
MTLINFKNIECSVLPIDLHPASNAIVVYHCHARRSYGESSANQPQRQTNQRCCIEPQYLTHNCHTI